MTVFGAILMTKTSAVPVSASSLIHALADNQTHQVTFGGEPIPADLLSALTAVTDPRARRGRRHAFTAVLGIAVCAVLAGARSYVAIAEWAVACQRDGTGGLPRPRDHLDRVVMSFP